MFETVRDHASPFIEALGKGDDPAGGEVAGLPSALEPERIESRLFDLTALRMQLAMLEGDAGMFEAHRQRVIDMAAPLAEERDMP